MLHRIGQPRQLHLYRTFLFCTWMIGLRIQNLYKLIPNRLTEVVKSNGYPIVY